MSVVRRYELALGAGARISDLEERLARAEMGADDPVRHVVPGDFTDCVRPFQGRGDIVRSAQSRGAGRGLLHAAHLEGD